MTVDKKIIPVAVGFAAKQLASLVYTCGLAPKMAQSLYIDPLLSQWNIPIAVQYDPASRRVAVSSLGCSAIAEARENVGARLLMDEEQRSPLPSVDLPVITEKPLSSITPEEYARRFSAQKVTAALDHAFLQKHWTLAVAVLHKGKLAAERYAEGINASTPLPGWSMAKSITATLAGLLIKRGELDLRRPGIVSAWRDKSDGREKVTLDHLLRMTSGLDLTEDQSGMDPNSRMLFVEPDTAAFAAKQKLKAAPGAHWEYMSGNTILASRAVYTATGATLESSQRFYRRELFAPLGAPSFVLETDAAGTFVGSSYAIATARDWAKFGQLYLQDGVWEGRQLLPADWRAYVTRHTPESGENRYGAGFWTAEQSKLPAIPKDVFYANGFQGQYVIMVPSRSLVLVRLGASHGSDGIWELLADMIAAIK